VNDKQSPSPEKKLRVNKSREPHSGYSPRPAGGSDQFLCITIGLDIENEAVPAALGAYMQA
jgi:hypothetical protein